MLRSLTVLVGALLLPQLLPGTAVAGQGSGGDLVLYVAQHHRGASDSNKGSATHPYRTIGKALQVAMSRYLHGQSTEVLVGTGVYREGLSLKGDPQYKTSAYVGLQALPGSSVVVSGSDQWHHWQPAGTSGLYTHSWPYNWGIEPVPSSWAGSAGGTWLADHPVTRLHEMIFIDGRPFQQVMSLADVRSGRGQFFVDEGANLVYVHLPAGFGQIPTSGLEVSMRAHVLSVYGMRNVTISGIDFIHGASSLMSTAASVYRSVNVTFVNDHFDWNNSVGLSLANMQNFRVINSSADHNGIGGIQGWELRDGHVIQSSMSYNDWRGSRGWNLSDHSSVWDANFIDFATGQKFFHVHNLEFVADTAVGNLTGGLWFDTDNSGVVIRDSRFAGNLTQGIFDEANQGPMLIAGNAICGNEEGVLISNSSHAVVAGNVFGGNIISQIFVGGQAEPRYVQDSTTGQSLGVLAQNWTLYGNRIASDWKQQAVSTSLPTDGWRTFVKTLRSNKNIWAHPRRKDVFQVANGHRLGLRAWRGATGQDHNSVFTTSPGAVCRG